LVAVAFITSHGVKAIDHICEVAILVRRRKWSPWRPRR
jgi:hypothetical protein